MLQTTYQRFIFKKSGCRFEVCFSLLVYKVRYIYAFAYKCYRLSFLEEALIRSLHRRLYLFKNKKKNPIVIFCFLSKNISFATIFVFVLFFCTAPMIEIEFDCQTSPILFNLKIYEGKKEEGGYFCAKFFLLLNRLMLGN